MSAVVVTLSGIEDYDLQSWSEGDTCFLLLQSKPVLNRKSFYLAGEQVVQAIEDGWIDLSKGEDELKQALFEYAQHLGAL